MWKINLDIFIYALYIQVILVIVTVIASYLLYFIYRSRKLAQQKNVAQIKAYLQQTTKPIFAKRLGDLSCLLLAIQDIDERKQHEFVKEHMLPIARNYAQKTGWFSRFLAAKTFSIYAMPEDEKIIAELIQDKKPTVGLECVHAIVHLPTELLLNTLIDKTATLRRKSYDLYLEPFEHLPESKREIIVKRLTSEKDPYKRDICYRILMFFEPEPLSDLARNDAMSRTINLCLSAIRFIAYSEGKKALPFLQEIQNDKRRGDSRIALIVADILKRIGKRGKK